MKRALFIMAIIAWAYLIGACAFPSPSGSIGKVDVSDPQRPQRVGFVLIPACQLATEGNYLYVGGQDALYIVDVSHPNKPRVVAKYATPRPVFGIAVIQDFVYLAIDSAGLLVVDAASPSIVDPIVRFSSKFRAGSWDGVREGATENRRKCTGIEAEPQT